MSDKSGNASEDPFALRYWQAAVAFGPAAVEGTLTRPDVASRHSELVHKLSVSDEQSRRGTMLPRDVVFEIAAHPECKDDYYADPDGKRLYSVERRLRDRGAPRARGNVLIDNREALQEYSAYCLFMASD